MLENFQHLFGSSPVHEDEDCRNRWENTSIIILLEWLREFAMDDDWVMLVDNLSSDLLRVGSEGSPVAFDHEGRIEFGLLTKGDNR